MAQEVILDMESFHKEGASMKELEVNGVPRTAFLTDGTPDVLKYYSYKNQTLMLLHGTPKGISMKMLANVAEVERHRTDEGEVWLVSWKD